jgi:hypothetical protein
MQRRDRGERHRRRDGGKDIREAAERKGYWKETELKRQRGETEDQR